MIKLSKEQKEEYLRIRKLRVDLDVICNFMGLYKKDIIVLLEKGRQDYDKRKRTSASNFYRADLKVVAEAEIEMAESLTTKIKSGRTSHLAHIWRLEDMNPDRYMRTAEEKTADDIKIAEHFKRLEDSLKMDDDD